MHKRKRCSNIFDTILDYIFGPKKDKLFCPVFVFCRDMSNANCDLVLYLQSEGLNISLIKNGIRNTVFYSLIGSQFIFLK